MADEYDIDKLGYKREVSSINAASGIILKASLAKKTDEFIKEKKAQGIIGLYQHPIAVTSGKRLGKPKSEREKSKIKGYGDEEDNLIDSKLQGMNRFDLCIASWVSLQRKAEQYNKLQDNDDDDDEQHLLVDFLKKHDSSVNEEMVEIVDELGRTRLVRQSQVEKNPVLKGFVNASPNNTVTNNTPDAGNSMISADMLMEQERLRWESEATQQQTEQTNVHYDTRQEIRTLGVGHYQFSQDLQEREEQMSKIKNLRNETLTNRERVLSARREKQVALEKRRLLVEAKTREIAEKKRRRIDSASAYNDASRNNSADVDSFLASLIP